MIFGFKVKFMGIIYLYEFVYKFLLSEFWVLIFKLLFIGFILFGFVGGLIGYFVMV